MQTIIIIIIVVVIIIIIIMIIIIIIIVWFGPICFSSKFIAAKAATSPSYLINWTILLYILRFFVLLSSAGLFP